jgi:hypothetical protein
MAIRKPRKTEKATTKVAAKTSFLSRFKNYSFGESRAYLFEYGLLLLVLGALLASLISMVESIVPYLGSQDSERLFGGLEYDMSLLTLSAVIVLLPLSVILIQRTAETERTNPFIKNSSWRKAFLGIFLVSIVLPAIVLTIEVVNELVTYVADADAAFDWRAVLSGGLAVSILAITGLVFSQDYRYVPVNRYARLQHLYRYGLLAGALIAVLLFILMPLNEQADQRNDRPGFGSHLDPNTKCGGRGHDAKPFKDDLRFDTKQDLELIQPDLEY